MSESHIPLVVLTPRAGQHVAALLPLQLAPADSAALHDRVGDAPLDGAADLGAPDGLGELALEYLDDGLEERRVAARIGARGRLRFVGAGAGLGLDALGIFVARLRAMRFMSTLPAVGLFAWRQVSFWHVPSQGAGTHKIRRCR